MCVCVCVCVCVNLLGASSFGLITSLDNFHFKHDYISIIVHF